MATRSQITCQNFRPLASEGPTADPVSVLCPEGPRRALPSPGAERAPIQAGWRVGSVHVCEQGRSTSGSREATAGKGLVSGRISKRPLADLGQSESNAAASIVGVPTANLLQLCHTHLMPCTVQCRPLRAVTLPKSFSFSIWATGSILGLPARQYSARYGTRTRSLWPHGLPSSSSSMERSTV